MIAQILSSPAGKDHASVNFQQIVESKISGNMIKSITPLKSYVALKPIKTNEQSTNLSYHSYKKTETQFFFLFFLFPCNMYIETHTYTCN